MRTKNRRFFVQMVTIVALCFGGCSSGSEVLMDCYATGQYKKMSLPAFSLYTMNVQSPEGSRIDVFIQMPYNRLRYEKTETGFKSAYTVILLIKNERQEIVQTREVDRLVTAKTYSETVSSLSDMFAQFLIVAPGNYTLEAAAIDNASGLRYQHREKISVHDFRRDSISASTFLFLENAVRDAKGISLHPVLPASLSFLRDSFGIFQEVYGLRNGDSIVAELMYRRPSLPAESDHRFLYQSPPYFVSPPSCTKEYDSLYYRHDSVLVAQATGTVQLFQFYPLPSVGLSVVDRWLRIYHNERWDTLRQSLRILRQAPLSWKTTPADEMLDAIRWIMREEEYDTLIHSDGAGRDRLIAEFWEKHGGIQRKGEFERRISDADEMFTKCIEGSRTPMGITYIVCGAPEYVDCRSDYNETWYYAVGNRTMSVPFRIERRGEANKYYELTPFSVASDLWLYFYDLWRRR